MESTKATVEIELHRVKVLLQSLRLQEVITAAGEMVGAHYQ